MSAKLDPLSRSWTFLYIERDIHIEEADARSASTQSGPREALLVLFSALVEVFILWWARYVRGSAGSKEGR